jgi:hypothetical protein
MGKLNLSECFKIHAVTLDLEDYHNILSEKNDKSKEAINRLAYKDLVKYANLVKTDFMSYNDKGEIQYKSLVEIFMEKNPKELFIQNMYENIKYIIEIEASATLTIEKINNKIDTLTKTLNEDKRFEIKNKLEDISYKELMDVLKSKDSLRGFIAN